MAVFMLNVCKFNGCGLTFKSLGDLIQHIEETHIDYDPRVVEQTEQQQPTCIPLSYVLRFLTDAARKEATKPVHQSRSNQTCLPQAARNKSNTPTGSEAEEGDDFVSEPEDSNDSWTTSSEFSADFIFRYGSRLNDLPSTTYSHDIRLPNFERVVNENVVTQNNNADKPFACPVPGCKKRYKNVNGIKYHSKNGHKNDGKVRKAFRCPCGKSYKTTYGLKNHTNLRHGSSLLQVKLLHQNNKSLIKYESDYENNMNSRSENISYGNTGSSISKTAKSKVSAIEDHGYIKQERSSVIFNKDSLGILTPASSPPLPLNTSPKIEMQPSKSAKEYSSQLHYPIAANNSRYN